MSAERFTTTEFNALLRIIDFDKLPNSPICAGCKSCLLGRAKMSVTKIEQAFCKVL